MSATQIISETPRLPLEAIQASPAWGLLTVKQRMWMESWIASNGDALLATKAAFDCSSERNAQVMNYEILQNPKIRAVMDLYLGRTPREAFLDGLQKRIEDGSLSLAQMEGIRYLCQLRGWDIPETAKGSKPEVPNGCRPIFKNGVTVGYLDSDGKRTNF